MHTNTTQPDRNRLVIAAGETPEWTDIIKSGAEGLKEQMNKNTTEEGNTTQADALGKPYSEMAQQDQDAKASLVASGLDISLYAPYLESLKSIPLLPTTAAQFLNKFAMIALEHSADPQLVIAIGVAVAMRAKSLSAGDPKRIVAVVEAAMDTIARYDQKLPSHGVFQIASDAAHGRPFVNSLTMFRMLLSGQGVAYGQSADLARALTALVTPNNADVGGLLDEYSNQRTLYQQERFDLASQFGRIYIAYETERDKYLQGILETINKYMPSVASNPLFQTYMRGLFAASSVSALNSMKNQLFGGDTNNPLQNALSGEGSTPVRKSSTRFAQADPKAQQQQQAASGAYGITPSLTDSMSQANRGTEPANFANTNQQSQQALALGSDLDGLIQWIATQTAAFEKSYQMVQTMASVQTLAPSSGGTGQTMMDAANFTGGTIAAVAAQTMQMGVNLWGALDKMHRLLPSVIQSGAAEMRSNQQAGQGQANQLGQYVNQNTSASGNQQMQENYWRRVTLDGQMRTLKSIQVMSPATDFIRQQIPEIESLELDIQASGGKQSTSGAVGKLAGLCQAVARQFSPILMTYANITRTAKDANTQGWATQQYKYAALYRKQWMVKALTYVRQMKEGKWGSGVSGGLSSVSTGRVSAIVGDTRFASDLSVRSVDKEIEDYLNSLYGDTDARGYGTLLEHIEEHENDLSTQVDPEPLGEAGEKEHIEKKLHRRFR